MGEKDNTRRLFDAAIASLNANTAIIGQSDRPGCFAVMQPGVKAHFHVLEFKVLKGSNIGIHPVDTDVFPAMISNLIHAFAAGSWQLTEVDGGVFDEVVASVIIDFEATEIRANGRIRLRFDTIDIEFISV